MRRTARILLVAVGAALLCLPEQGSAQDTDELAVTLARARFTAHRATAAPRHMLKIKGTFPLLEALQSFDPTVDALRVSVADVTVVSVPASTDAAGYHFRTRRQEVRTWRYRVKGEPGAVGLRTFSANVRTGRFKLVIKRADLLLLRDAGASDATVSVTVGDATAETSFSFVVTRQANPVRWLYRTIPDPPPPTGPLAFTSLVSWSLSNTPRPHVEIARTQQEFTVMWTALGNPGPEPQVDFSQDMVVTVSSLVVGPGQFPPLLDIVAVRGRGFMEIDWRLALCEESFCPGAPIPCPTATPYHVFKVRQYAGEVRTRQQPTVAVCP